MQDLRIISKAFDENSNGLVICNAFLWETNSLAAAKSPALSLAQDVQ